MSGGAFPADGSQPQQNGTPATPSQTTPQANPVPPPAAVHLTFGGPTPLNMNSPQPSSTSGQTPITRPPNPVPQQPFVQTSTSIPQQAAGESFMDPFH